MLDGKSSKEGQHTILVATHKVGGVKLLKGPHAWLTLLGLCTLMDRARSSFLHDFAIHADPISKSEV